MSEWDKNNNHIPRQTANNNKTNVTKKRDNNQKTTPETQPYGLSKNMDVAALIPGNVHID